MKITVDGQVFDYDASRLLNTEAIALQRVMGMPVPDWTKAMQKGDAIALTGLVWLLWRRAGRDVPFDDVEFDLGSIEVEDDEPVPAVEKPKGPARKAATPTDAEPATET